MNKRLLRRKRCPKADRSLWRRNRVYPNFLLRLTGDGARLLVLETKSKQLDNEDTAFKRDLMDALQNAYQRPAAGEVELFDDSPESVRFTANAGGELAPGG
ncbi:MAG: hypothetical protein V3V60_11615 [Sphingomonas aquatilis]|uniref:hypothetical protein n=1 Tax=Sphingomonas aquatilis TaxID=93063 RepID=UPI002F3155A2